MKSLFQQISMHFAKNELIGMATDVAIWELKLINSEGKVFHYTGPMLRKCQPFLDNISDELRSLLKVENLFAFDGNP